MVNWGCSKTLSSFDSKQINVRLSVTTRAGILNLLCYRAIFKTFAYCSFKKEHNDKGNRQINDFAQLHAMLNFL